MNKLILLVFCVHVAADEPMTTLERKIMEKSKLLPKAPVCGTELHSRLFGGNEANIYEFNWLALLQYSKPDEPPGFHCGGSLINNRYVLTAAQCLDQIPSSWNLTSVCLGENDLGSGRDCDPDEEEVCMPPVQDIEIAERIRYPGYKFQNSIHDIALLRLKKTVEFNNYVKPICLPLQRHLWNKDYSGNNFVSAGWGHTQSGRKSDKKLLVWLPFVDLNECQENYTNGRTLDKGQMCADGDPGKDSCTGDSGGPLMIKELENTFGPYYVAGIVSHGPGVCGEENVPRVYTKVADYLEWIVDTIRK